LPCCSQSTKKEKTTPTSPPTGKFSSVQTTWRLLSGKKLPAMPPSLPPGRPAQVRPIDLPVPLFGGHPLELRLQYICPSTTKSVFEWQQSSRPTPEMLSNVIVNVFVILINCQQVPAWREWSHAGHGTPKWKRNWLPTSEQNHSYWNGAMTSRFHCVYFFLISLSSSRTWRALWPHNGDA
jgi:hypothetical protein